MFHSTHQLTHRRVVFIAHELGKYGITVNAYAPGPTKTGMSQSLCLDASHPHKEVYLSTADEMVARFGPALSAVSELS